MARWVSGIILAVGVVALILYAPVVYLKFIIIGLSLIGSWEFLTIALGKQVALKYLGALFTLVGCFTIVFAPSNLHYFELFYIIIVLGFITQFPGKEDISEKIKNASIFVFGVFYCVILFGLLALLTNQPHYKFWVFLTIAATFAGDTGAYLVGKAFGRNKLAPQISPGKTVEGVIGGLLGGLIAALIVQQIFRAEFNVFFAMGLGMVIVVIGTLGDLSESLLKRGFGVKDSGTIIPGHGGLLDRIDGLLFSAPFVYFVSNYI